MEPFHGSRAPSDPDARGADVGAESDLQQVCTHEAVPLPDDGSLPARMYAAAGVQQTPRARVVSVAELGPAVLQDISPEIHVFNFSPEMSNFAFFSEISVFLVFCIFILIILFI
jgi:hypothetical protein